MNAERYAKDPRYTVKMFLAAYFVLSDYAEAGRYLDHDASLYLDGVKQDLLSKTALTSICNLARSGAHMRFDLKIEVIDSPSKASVMEGLLRLYSRETEDTCLLRLFVFLKETNDTLLIRTMQFSRIYMPETDFHSYDFLPIGILFAEQAQPGTAALYFNDAAAATAGYSREEFQKLILDDFTGFLLPEDVAQFTAYLSDVQAGCAHGSCDVRSRAQIFLRLTASQHELSGRKNACLITITKVPAEKERADQVTSIISAIPGCAVDVSISDSGIRTTYWNSAFIEEIGATYVAGIPSAQNLEFPHVCLEDRSMVMRGYQNILDGMETINVNFRCRNRQNEHVWLNLNLRRNTSGDGRFRYSGILSVVQNIDSTMEALSQRKNLFEKTFSSLPVGIGVFETIGETVTPLYCNEKMNELLGMSRDYFFSSFNAFTPYGNLRPDSYEAMLEAYRANGRFKPFATICEIKQENETSIWARIICSPTLEDGRLIIYVVMYNVSHVVELNRNSLWKSERYRLLSEASQIDIFDYDPLENVLSLSLNEPSHNAGEIVIPNASDFLRTAAFVHPEDRALYAEILNDIFQKNGSDVYKVRLQLREEQYHWYKVFYSSIKDESGQFIRVVGRLEGIQKEKDAEAALAARLRLEKKFRSSTVNPLIAMEFDLDTGARIKIDGEVAPGWMEKLSFAETISLLRNGTDRSIDRQMFEAILTRDTSRVSCEAPESLSCICRLHLFFLERQASLWCEFSLVFARNDFNHHLHVFLKIVEASARGQEGTTGALSGEIDDAQTGTLSHATFERMLEQYLAERIGTQSGEEPLCVAILGLYDIGDMEDSDRDFFRNEIIGKTLRMIEAWLRPNEVLGRYSVDEFSIFLTDGHDEAEQAERLRILYAGLRLLFEDQPSLSVNIGYSTVSSSETSVSKILRRTGRALYWARVQGKSGFVAHTPEVDHLIRNTSFGIPKNTTDSVGHSIGQPAANSGIFVRTFGHFDVFVDGKAILFSNAKSKELLALLVDRGGGFLSAAEAISNLWENEPVNDYTLARYRKAAMYLKNTLETHQAAEILDVVKGKRRVIREKFLCDYYMCTQSDDAIIQYFTSSYMVEYSWAENTISSLEALRRKAILKQHSNEASK